MEPPPPREGVDWTTGAPKWAAVLVLGGAAVLGMAWSIGRGGVEAWPRGAPGGGPAGMAAPREAAPPESSAGSSPDSSSTAPAGARAIDVRIDINSASRAELELLPGVGEVLAREIVADRERNGPFRSVDDLDRVKGIGAVTVERLRDRVKVGP